MAERPRDQRTPELPDEIPAFLKQSKHDIQNRFVDLEWQQRNRLAAGIQQHTPENPSQWARLTGDHVLARNRYLNVEPFAANRVKLQVAPGVNDYINASPIVLGNRRYIATQGPKDTSTSHFYRMLAAETAGPAVVVMLTQTHEAGREKCFPYFPDTPDNPLLLQPDQDVDDTFEGTVTLLDTQHHDSARSTVRKLLLKTRETEESPWHEKEIYHCLFTAWPDFGIPEGENKDAMFHLITLSESLNAASTPPPTSSFPLHEEDAIAGAEQAPPVDSAPQPTLSLNPRVVHCSAGVGRSGTFIALDYLFAQLAVGALDNIPPDSDPIADTVDKLRQQRMMMVQGESQFSFLYEALRDAWLQRWRAEQTDHS